MAKSVLECITLRDRGRPWRDSIPLPYIKKRAWKHTKTIFLGGNQPVTYIRGREDYLFCITAHNHAYFSLTSSGFSLSLLKPSEIVLRIIVTDIGTYLIVKRTSETHLRVYLLDAEILRTGVLKRERVFKQLILKAGTIKKADAKYKKLVIQQDSSVYILDLTTETVVYKGIHLYGVNAWYSRNNLILGEFTIEGAVFVIRELDSNMVRAVKARNALDILNIEIIPNQVVITCRKKPVVVVNLANSKCHYVNRTPAKYYLETERLEDACVIEENGKLHFAGNNGEFSLNNTSAPLFTDTEDTLVLFTDGILNMLHQNGEFICSTEVLRKEKATAIGMNGDSGEVYIGYSKGKVLVLQ